MAHAETIATYNRHALEIGALLDRRGGRESIIEQGLELAGWPINPSAIELGCGTGRDAEQIVPRVEYYEGFDPSQGLIEIARQRVPNAQFVVADALDYPYPSDVDVVYGFASFVHLDRDEFRVAWPPSISSTKAKWSNRYEPTGRRSISCHS